MNIGYQIRSLRLRRGVTQEALAQQLCISPQAVSKWETGLSVPDIGMLPGLSAYFGVSIDELFALSDDVRMERIENMLGDVRFLQEAEVEQERRFLQEKARREPGNPDPWRLLAELELHQVRGHNARAEEYALELMVRSADAGPGTACAYLARAMGGARIDPRHNNRCALVSHYKRCLALYPGDRMVRAALITQLIADHRLAEAETYCQELERLDGGYFAAVHRARLHIARDDRAAAEKICMQLDETYPDSWNVQHWIGDLRMLMGDYAGAKAHCLRAIELLEKPRYADPMDSLAQVCEMDEDIPGALEARRMELDAAMQDWRLTTGETVEGIQREIARLELQEKE